MFIHMYLFFTFYARQNVQLESLQNVQIFAYASRAVEGKCQCERDADTTSLGR